MEVSFSHAVFLLPAASFCNHVASGNAEVALPRNNHFVKELRRGVNEWWGPPICI